MSEVLYVFKLSLYLLTISLVASIRFVGTRSKYSKGLTRESTHLKILPDSLERMTTTTTAGSHGEGFNYLPLIQGSSDEHFPRIAPIAGMYPTLSVADILAPLSSPAVAPGTWSYDFPDPEGPQMGSIAIPGSHLVTSCADPVAIVVKNTDLRLPYPQEVDCVVVVDRKDRVFVPDQFYLFQTPSGDMKIQWRHRLDSGYTIVGRIVIVMGPSAPSLTTKKPMFLEEDED